LEIAVGELAHHCLGEARLVVEHVVGNLQGIGDAAGVLNVLTSAASAFAADCLAMVVELEGNAHDIVTFGLHQRRDDGGIDSARHGHNHPVVSRAAGRVKTVKCRGL